MTVDNKPTIIDSVDVFDSDGTLSLMVNGYDVMYLRKCQPDADAPTYPILTDEQHQKIIDVIVEALGCKES